MPENWERPRLGQNLEHQEPAFDARIARAGLVVFVISILLYAFVIWSLSIILRNSSIIDGSVSWSNAYMAAGILQVLRIIDRTLWAARR